MTLFKLTLIPAMLAAALLGGGAEAGASTPSSVVNKSDLGISLYDVDTNTEGKSDCDCVESLYGSSTVANGFHKGYGEDALLVVITPAAVSTAEGIISEPVVKTKRKKLKRVAMKDGTSTIRRKTKRATACVFGAPNASGCWQN